MYTCVHTHTYIYIYVYVHVHLCARRLDTPLPGPEHFMGKPLPAAQHRKRLISANFNPPPIIKPLIVWSSLPGGFALTSKDWYI